MGMGPKVETGCRVGGDLMLKAEAFHPVLEQSPCIPTCSSTSHPCLRCSFPHLHKACPGFQPRQNVGGLG